MGYFLSEIYQKKNVISYDEYLCLYPIINMQYENIRVIENNIYLNLFPLNIELSDEIKNKLLCNYGHRICFHNQAMLCAFLKRTYLF